MCIVWFCCTSAFFCEFCSKCPCPRHFFNFHFNCFSSLVNLSPKLGVYLVEPNERFHWLFAFVNWFTLIFILSLYKMSPFHFNFRNKILYGILLLIVTSTQVEIYRFGFWGKFNFENISNFSFQPLCELYTMCFFPKNWIYDKIDLTSVTGPMNTTSINSFKNFSQNIAECAIYHKLNFLEKRVLFSFRELRNVDKNFNFRNALTSVTKFRTSWLFEFLVSYDYGFSHIHIKRKMCFHILFCFKDIQTVSEIFYILMCVTLWGLHAITYFIITLKRRRI